MIRIGVLSLLAVAVAIGTSASAQTSPSPSPAPVPAMTQDSPPLTTAAPTTPPVKKSKPEKKKGAKNGAKTGAKKKDTKSGSALVFKGELTAVDNSLKTITVGTTTYEITSTTRVFTGANTPAILQDGIVGQAVRGTYKKAADGKLIANTVHFGSQAEAKPAGTKKVTPKK